MAGVKAATRICASEELVDQGRGVRFDVQFQGQARAAFAVRYRGRVYGYINACAHRAIELDWDPGAFFDEEGEHIVCATHGALYAPQTGTCVAGPCLGARLAVVPLEERSSEVHLRPTNELQLLDYNGDEPV